MKDLNDILGMATKMQEELQKAQNDLESVQVEGVAGGGLVRITATAKGRVTRIALDDSLIVPSDKTMLEDLIVAAFNDARVKAEEAAGQHMGKITSGLPIPPGFKLPF